ncbi:MAG: ribulose-phosphate 3-epimerase [Desulfatibacillaceae bacterium]|nr:ribulose-phosphate 3-epimerase [Desulfatibacillaceae bacterium]
MKLIAPSILSADFSRLGDEIRAVEQAGADWIHIDVMDGCFVPNITIGPLVVEAAKKVTKLPLDVHLMIERPERYIDDFVKAGADIITVHPEACIHLNRTLCAIREHNIKAGVTLNPSTPLSCLDWILEYCDVVMLMSVNPGFGGQSFIENTLPKITQLVELIRHSNANALIEVDGGVNSDTIAGISRAGADVFVAGSAVFKSKNYKATIENLKKLAG